MIFTLISLNVKGRFNWGLNMVSVSTQWCQLGHRTYIWNCLKSSCRSSCSCSRVAVLSQVGLKQQLWCIISSQKRAQRSFVFGGNKKHRCSCSSSVLRGFFFFYLFMRWMCECFLQVFVHWEKQTFHPLSWNGLVILDEKERCEMVSHPKRWRPAFPQARKYEQYKT